MEVPKTWDIAVDLRCVQDEGSWSNNQFGDGGGLLSIHRYYSIILVISP